MVQQLHELIIGLGLVIIAFQLIKALSDFSQFKFLSTTLVELVRINKRILDTLQANDDIMQSITNGVPATADPDFAAKFANLRIPQHDQDSEHDSFHIRHG